MRGPSGAASVAALDEGGVHLPAAGRPADVGGVGDGVSAAITGARCAVHRRDDATRQAAPGAPVTTGTGLRMLQWAASSENAYNRAIRPEASN